MHRQELAVVEAVGVELGAVVEMAGNDERVAGHAALAGRGEPIAACPRCTSSTNRYSSRGRWRWNVSFSSDGVDGDGAHRLRCGAGIGRPNRGQARQQGGRGAEEGSGQAVRYGMRQVFHKPRRRGKGMLPVAGALRPAPARRSGRLQLANQRVDHVVAGRGRPAILDARCARVAGWRSTAGRRGSGCLRSRPGRTMTASAAKSRISMSRISRSDT